MKNSATHSAQFLKKFKIQIYINCILNKRKLTLFRVQNEIINIIK